MPVNSVVIMGGGVAGWLAASMLARQLPDIRVTVVDGGGPDRSLGIATCAETLFPADLELLDAAGYDEDALIFAARGAFSLGTALVGWGIGGAPGFVPFGDIGAPLGATPFHQLVLRRRAEGRATNFANFALSALCAQSGRFARPLPGDHSVHGTLRHGVQLATAALGNWLRDDAMAHGAQQTSGTSVREQCSKNGKTLSVQTDGGEILAADFFVDATGPALVHHSNYASWRNWLPCDRAATVLAETRDAPPLYTHVEAHTGGWQAFVPIRGGIAETFVYASDAIPDGPAAAAFESGRLAAPWQHNRVAIGGAAAVIDPVAGTQLHLALGDVARFIALFPNNTDCEVEAAEYNRQFLEVTDCAFDCATLHYARNLRRGEPFWDQCRKTALPERLAHRIALYESCGRLALHDGESFEGAAWIAHFDALGIEPLRHDALANAWPSEQVETHLTRVREAMLKAVAAMPLHAEYLARLGR